MKIINTPPPNWADIKKVFPMLKWNDEVIVTYYPNVYCKNAKLSAFKIAHENVHIYQQEKMGVEAWWQRYLGDKQFRLQQEVEAYREELFHIKTHPELTTRDQRRRYINNIVELLASDMYGNLVTRKQAEKLLL